MATSNIERLFGDIDCTMADSDYTMVNDYSLGESNSQSLTQEQPPVIKKALLEPEENTRGSTIKDEVGAYKKEVCM